jgi:hypothetical protein
MGEIELEYLDKQRDRHGRVRYCYFRRNGRRWKLPAAPGSPEFMEAYHRALAETAPGKPREPHPPKSLGALIDKYLVSPEFRDLKPRSQRVYRLVLEPLGRRRMAQEDVRRLKRRNVKALRDEKAETPGMANLTVSVVSALLRYARDEEWIEHNPALGVKKFKLGEHRAWSDCECAAFEARWAPGTMERRCYVLARCSGQRAGDLARMTRAHRVGGFIHVVQEKTGKELDIPELQQLKAELARGEQGHMSLLTKPDGSAFRDGADLSPWFAAAIEEAGLPDDCVLHGLRKLTAKTLAEAGCSAHLIGSITGHEPSSPEIVRYTRQADQRKMATAAILKLEANGDRTGTAKQGAGRTAKHSGKR